MIEKPDGSIYGDGVNVAARLESLAEPGGVCISGRVFEQIEGKLDVGFAYLGPQSVKNIEKPVNVYKVLLDPYAIALAGTDRWDFSRARPARQAGCR